MRVEVLLSVLKLNKNNLKNMNITSRCTIINQCGKNNFEKYKNFNIYSYDELGTANSRNRGLEHISEDIILLCDEDVVYNDDYENKVINEFKNNPKADIIVFNFINPYRKKRINKRRKRVYLHNSLNYASYNIAFKRNSIGNIKFNTLFGPNAKFISGGDDSLFLVDCLKNKLKVYTSPVFIGKISNDKSTWFKGFNEQYFFDRGAFFTAVSYKLRHLLMLQFLIRHREVLTNYKLLKAYKIMLKGSKEYINETRN